MTATTAKSFRPTLTSLEDRCLMAAGITAKLVGDGLLSVTGTEARDVIVVRQVNGVVSVDGVHHGWYASTVRGVVVDARGGDDLVLLNSEALAGQQPIVAPAVLLGGSGNDALVGGAASDLIFGGDGHDRAWGNTGHDVVFGGAGDDALMGNDGNDVLFGQAGADRVWGVAGDDVLDGGSGRDFLYGQVGKDLFFDEALFGANKDYRPREDISRLGSIYLRDQQVLVVSMLSPMMAGRGQSSSAQPLAARAAALVSQSPYFNIPGITQAGQVLNTVSRGIYEQLLRPYSAQNMIRAGYHPGLALAIESQMRQALRQPTVLDARPVSMAQALPAAQRLATRGRDLNYLLNSSGYRRDLMILGGYAHIADMNANAGGWLLFNDPIISALSGAATQQATYAWWQQQGYFPTGMNNPNYFGMASSIGLGLNSLGGLNFLPYFG